MFEQAHKDSTFARGASRDPPVRSKAPSSGRAAEDRGHRATQAELEAAHIKALVHDACLVLEEDATHAPTADSDCMANSCSSTESTDSVSQA
eukprot:3317990-Amphidinium_carterae.1